ncbi:NAD(P)/FAD-dependent oxidoreductase [Sphingomonas crocodyli]|uniref:FAD/NAD(P)-dependent oxidoreductase n=1 Tax=Sphingomonas crocodyli TaxID=1979270 RepID=UPI001F0C0DE0|nr:NAD(P)/FAD-dependent oxidoreductase [Sphingomonas crocodyli]
MLVVGAGPAGMSTALDLQSRGVSVTVADDQPAPGGRIFASIENRNAHSAEDREGAELVRRFRASGGTYLPNAEVWQIEKGPRVFLSHGGRTRVFEPDFLVLATGAQERPMPFQGWELPGVMTVGSAQILLKVARQIPDKPVWLAGSGPLLLLYAHQLTAAGGRVAGLLDTTPPNSMARSLRYLPGALAYGWKDICRGLRWTVETSGLPAIRHVVSLEARGGECLERVQYETSSGTTGEIDTELLLVHDGVVPALHATLAAGCEHRWNDRQSCFEPVRNRFGQSSEPKIFIAGDGATIAGARAARLSGQLVAIGILAAAEQMPGFEAIQLAKPLERALNAAARFRRFIDAAYPPVELAIQDGATVCRCEEVKAVTIRSSLEGRTHLGTDGVKIATRAGMGPCQGRQCGLSLVRLVAEAQGVERRCVAFPRIRPPLKPLTLGELADLQVSR